jgi:hypothetical protein
MYVTSKLSQPRPRRRRKKLRYSYVRNRRANSKLTALTTLQITIDTRSMASSPAAGPCDRKNSTISRPVP